MPTGASVGEAVAHVQQSRMTALAEAFMGVEGGKADLFIERNDLDVRHGQKG